MPPVFHDNHLMRFVPLIPSHLAPGPWQSFGAVELLWTGSAHPQWTPPAAAPEVHALHLPALPWDDALGELALAALRPRLGMDFLVIPAQVPADRLTQSRFLSVLEGLLEVTQGLGVKLALRPGPGSAPGLARLLKEARGEAVGFCWDAGVAGDLDCLSDRLFCAVGAPADDFSGLQRLGYRWNAALPAADPVTFRAIALGLEAAFPAVWFPAELPATDPVPAVTLGRTLTQPKERP